jgi:hypothetical protein
MNIGTRVEGSKVRLFGSKTEAQDAARAIRWPVKSAARVHTRFCVCWALAESNGMEDLYLSREKFAELWHQWNPGKEFA